MDQNPAGPENRPPFEACTPPEATCRELKHYIMDQCDEGHDDARFWPEHIIDRYMIYLHGSRCNDWDDMHMIGLSLGDLVELRWPRHPGRPHSDSDVWQGLSNQSCDGSPPRKTWNQRAKERYRELWQRDDVWSPSLPSSVYSFWKYVDED